MRKGFLIVLVVALVAAMAAPALAGMGVSGFIREKGYMSNFKNGATAPVLKQDAPTSAYVEQRLRVKFSFDEENVKAVWFLETDFGAYGDAAGGTPVAIGSGTADNDIYGGGAQRNSGAALGADRINLETKNIYIWFKIPNTSLDLTAGLQNQSDAYAGLIYGGADMAGFFLNGKVEPVGFTLGWAKLYENNYVKTDDVTLYVAAAKFAPSKDVKLGLNIYGLFDDSQKYVNGNTATGVQNLPFATTLASDTNTKRVWTPGIDVAFNAGPATVTGFFIYQWGSVDYMQDNVTDLNISAYALDLRADMNVGPGKMFLEGLYLSGGDNAEDKYKSIVTLNDVNASPGGNSAFTRTDMSILFGNADDINTNSALIGAAAAPGSSYTSNSGVCVTSPGNCGRGIWHIAGGYTQKVTDKTTAKFGAGYLAATKLLVSDQGGTTASTSRKGKGMGTEINANVNYNIMKGLDFGLYGAYAWLGDFYKSGLTGASEPDNPYDLHFRLNYAF